MEIRWSEKKNQRLIQTRGVGFQDLLDDGEIVLIDKHPSREGQWFMFVWYDRYIWVIPYVQNEEEIFLKTLYCSRKYTRRFFKGEELCLESENLN